MSKLLSVMYWLIMSILAEIDLAFNNAILNRVLVCFSVDCQIVSVVNVLLFISVTESDFEEAVYFVLVDILVLVFLLYGITVEFLDHQ